MRDVASSSRFLYSFSNIFSDLSLCGSYLIFIVNNQHVFCCFSVAVIEHSLQKHLEDRGFNLVYGSRGIESIMVRKVTKQQKLEAGCQEFHAMHEEESRTV